MDGKMETPKKENGGSQAIKRVGSECCLHKKAE